MYRTAFAAVLAAESAAAFAPTLSAFGGLRLQGADTPRPAFATARAPRSLSAGTPALRAQLGLNDKEGNTAVDDFKKDGKVCLSPGNVNALPDAAPSLPPLLSCC